MQYYSKTADNRLTFAPMVLEINGRIVTAPTVAQYAAKGYYPYRAAVPESREGYTHRVSDYEVVDGAWVPVYEYDPIPATAHRYETLKLYIGLVKIGKWEAAKEWLAAQTIADGDYAGVNALEAFNRVVVVRDDHPLFNAYYEALKTALDIDEATASAILAAAEADA